MTKGQREAVELMAALIGVGPWPVTTAKEVLESAGLSRYHIAWAAADLTAHGEKVMMTQRFWASPLFLNEKSGAPLYVEGHSRADLIRRLQADAPSRSAHTPITQELMEGEDAGRLAARDLAREVESWRG